MHIVDLFDHEDRGHVSCRNPPENGYFLATWAPAAACLRTRWRSLRLARLTRVEDFDRRMLAPSLVEVAQGVGHEAHHVNRLGLASTKDHDLMPRIVAENFVFVTHNAVDFRRLYRGSPCTRDWSSSFPSRRPPVTGRCSRRDRGGRRGTGLGQRSVGNFVEGEDVVFQQCIWPDH